MDATGPHPQKSASTPAAVGATFAQWEIAAFHKSSELIDAGGPDKATCRLRISMFFAPTCEQHVAEIRGAILPGPDYH
jgi:hypothetical protein